MAKFLTEIIKAGVGGLVVAGAVTVGSLSASNFEKNAGAYVPQTSSSEVVSSVEEEKPEKYTPITDEMRQAAEDCTYDFDPASIIIYEEEKYEFKEPAEDAEDPGYYNEDLAGLKYSNTREDHNLVYVFEGEYSEGYQGQYNTYLTGMYLWDDGLFTGKSNSTEFKGYWYNSSLNAPSDDPETEDVNESIDCLNLISNTSHFESIITEVPLGGAADFYERQAYVYMHPGWGDGRSVVVSGYKYYPNVAAFIDTNGYDKMMVGEKFIVNSTWFFDRVIQNLSYTPIIPNNEIKWTLPDGMIDGKKKLQAPGEYEITASWTDKNAKDEDGNNIVYEATAILEVI